MSTADWIALAQLTLSIIVAVVGGTLGILGYLKLLRSADENARERKEEIERNAKERQEAIEETGKRITAMQEENATKYTQQIRRQQTIVVCMFLWSAAIWLYTSKQLEKTRLEMTKKEK